MRPQSTILQLKTCNTATIPFDDFLSNVLHPTSSHTTMTETSCPILGRCLKPPIIQDETIEAVDEVPDPDPRNLETLIMSLSEERFQTVKQMFSLTPNLTPNEMRNILLEEDRKQAAQSATQGQGDKLGGNYCNECKKHSHSEDRCWVLRPELSRKPRCGACGKVGHGEDRCWGLNPALAPPWYQKPPLKNNAEAKGRGKWKKVKGCCLSKMVEEG